MKSRGNFHKKERIHILAKFHGKMLFGEIRAHLVILLLYMPKTIKSDRRDEIEIEMLYTPIMCKYNIFS